MIITLRPVPPFRLDLTVWALRRRPHNIVDLWDGETYRRALTIAGKPIAVAVRQTNASARPAIEVTTDGECLSSGSRAEIATAVERLLGLQRDLSGFYRIASRDPHLGPMAARLRGMKPPRFPTVFEALANAIACQQVSLTAGLHVLNRIVETFGQSFEIASGTLRTFPEPRAIAAADLEVLRKLGLSRQKARSLREVAAAFSEVHANGFDGLEALDDDAASSRLRQLRGVGPWTSGYALLRGLGRLNVFPAGDIGAWNALKGWLGMRGNLDDDKVRRRLARWSPYQGLIYIHLVVNEIAKQERLP
jgi:DNA-3-methyladenine glycosylase II